MIGAAAVANSPPLPPPFFCISFDCPPANLFAGFGVRPEPAPLEDVELPPANIEDKLLLVVAGVADLLIARPVVLLLLLLLVLVLLFVLVMAVLLKIDVD